MFEKLREKAIERLAEHMLKKIAKTAFELTGNSEEAYKEIDGVVHAFNMPDLDAVWERVKPKKAQGI